MTISFLFLVCFFFFCNFFIKKDFWAIPLREKCPYSELFWSAFFECGKNANSVRMRKNADQNNSEYGHFLLSVLLYFGNFLCKLSTSLAITVKILSKLLPVRNSIVNGLVVNVFCKTFHLKYLTEI